MSRVGVVVDDVGRRNVDRQTNVMISIEKFSMGLFNKGGNYKLQLCHDKIVL